MKAVLFAAGLGTRLHPHTLDKPKALVSIQGRPMLYRVMDRLYTAGIRDFVVNVHAFAGQIEKALNIYAQSRADIHIDISDERELLLETGGGLKKMAAFLHEEEAFLIHNVDVLSDIDLKGFVAQARKLLSTPVAPLTSSTISHSTPASPHSALTQVQNPEIPNESQEQSGEHYPLAVLAVRNSYSDRCFLLNQNNQLCGWENRRSGEQIISRQESEYRRVGFMGIHCVKPSIFSLMQEEGVFSITDVYLRLAARHAILGLDQSSCRWMDIGSPEQLMLAEKSF